MSSGETLSTYLIRNNDVDETRIANVFVSVTVVFKYDSSNSPIFFLSVF